MMNGPQHVRGYFIVSPVAPMSFCGHEQRNLLLGFTEIDYEPIFKLQIKFRHFFKYTGVFEKTMIDAKADYKAIYLETEAYDSYFEGFLHYLVKEISKGLVSLLCEINPSL